MAKLARLQVRAYRGIRALDVEVPPAGAIARGSNGAGKTTILRAIRAALLAQDIGPDAIAFGEDRAEILVDLDVLSARRTITGKTSTLTVSKDGFRAQKPQTLLTELLGTAALDPLDLILERDKKKRRATILAALPVTVTREQLEEWAPGALPADLSMEGHGLDVVARAHKAVYDQRAAANRALEQAERDLSAADKHARELPSPSGAIPLADARAASVAAKEHLVDLRARAAAAEIARARTESHRSSIARHKEKADEVRTAAMAAMPSDAAISAALDAAQAASDEVARMSSMLAAAKVAERAAADTVANVERAKRSAEEQLAKAAAHDEMAATLQSTLDASLPADVSADVVADAEANVVRCSKVLADSMAADEAIAASAAAESKRTAFRIAKKTADELDACVRRLANDAPASLMASCDGIQGLAIDGDDVTLDGKRMEALCGQEQISFAVAIAKRLNERSKILVVDGLERLDPDRMAEFIREATRDGWQLIGTCVDRGELVIQAIESEDA